MGSWFWGGGWLAEQGFVDFAGSTIVHSTGGWAALAGVLVIGPRLGKFRKDGTVKPTPPSNVLLVTLGVLILWLGWFGFNGGSQLALGSAADAVAMSNILVNTNLAAAAGVVAALVVSRPIFGRMDLFAGLNGALAGLVSITAAPDITEHWWAVIIGAIGGVICTAAIKALEKLKIDDVVGRHPRPPGVRHLGNAGGLHRGRRQLRHAAARRGGHRRLRVHLLADRVEADGHGHRPAGAQPRPSVWARTPPSWASRPIPSSCSCPRSSTTDRTSNRSIRPRTGGSGRWLKR